MTAGCHTHTAAVTGPARLVVDTCDGSQLSYESTTLEICDSRLPHTQQLSQVTQAQDRARLVVDTCDGSQLTSELTTLEICDTAGCLMTLRTSLDPFDTRWPEIAHCEHLSVANGTIA